MLGKGFLLALPIGIAAVQSCAYADGSNFRESGASALAVQSIFDQRCVVCHMPGAANGGLSLDQESVGAGLVGVRSTQSSLPLVSAGQPAASYLVRKIEGTHIQAGGNGERMPLGGALSVDEVALIRAWILSLTASPGSGP